MATLRVLTIVAAGLLTSAFAQADEADDGRRVDARESFEAAASASYAQGIGRLHPDAEDLEVTAPGIALELEAAYRVLPYAALGLTGVYHGHPVTEPIAGDVVIDESAHGLAFGVAARWHPFPFDRRDPWLRIGTGYRFMWMSDIDPDAPALSLRGPRVLQLGAGLDLWLADGFALGPFASWDLTVLHWPLAQRVDPALTSFLFGGVRVLFNVESMRSGPLQIARAD